MSPGKRTLTAQLSRSPGAPAENASGETAVRGLTGPSTPLPHIRALQASFGRHDVTGIDAHVAGPATQASSELGAQAYASGEAVAFATPPDLHLAAHEAAHVVQQRAGVDIDGGIGRDGDRYEQHADRVADAVVRGESAESLLDEMGPSGGDAGSSRAPIQSKSVQLRRNTRQEIEHLGNVVVRTEELFPTRSQGITLGDLDESNYQEHLADWVDDVMRDDWAEDVVAERSNAAALWPQLQQRARDGSQRIELVAHLSWSPDAPAHQRVTRVEFEIRVHRGEAIPVTGDPGEQPRPPLPEGTTPDTDEARDAIIEGGQDTARSPLPSVVSGGASLGRAATVFVGGTAEAIAAPVAAAMGCFQMMWAVFNIFNEVEGERAAGLGVVDFCWMVAAWTFDQQDASPHQEALRYAHGWDERGRGDIYRDALRPARQQAQRAYRQIRADPQGRAALIAHFDDADAFGEHLFQQTEGTRGRQLRVSAYAGQFRNRWVSSRTFFVGGGRDDGD